MNNLNYVPPKIWQSDGRKTDLNQPTSGSRYELELPVGKHPLQLYSLATPNGQKVAILLEELLALGFQEAEYDAWLIKISEGQQFSSGFVEINPNAKIPALVDNSQNPPLKVFESGSILLYLAERFKAFIPTDTIGRTQCLNWLFWQIGSGPSIGSLGHFYSFAPIKIEYAINRFAMETKRLLDVLNQHLAKHEYLAGTEYSIADIAAFPWYGSIVNGWIYSANDFLNVDEYKHVKRWADVILARPAVQRGRMVNRISGDLRLQLHERHDADDFETKTQDKLF